jgi:hypothetical protein
MDCNCNKGLVAASAIGVLTASYLAYKSYKSEALRVKTDKVDLAQLPTPIEVVPNLSLELGIEVSIKRDDLTGGFLAGNKIRKLEYLMAEA